jgi:hypothetical protein
MSKVEPYGFEIIQITEPSRTWYKIVDLTSDEPVYKVLISGSLKVGYRLQDLDGKIVLTAKRISILSNIYRFFKDDIRYATLSYYSNCCGSNYEIQTETKTFLGTSFKRSYFRFVGKEKKIVFEFYRGVKGRRKRNIVEVYDQINPEVALVASVILDRMVIPKRNRVIEHKAILSGFYK